MLNPFRKIRNTQHVSMALLIGVFFCAKMCTSGPDDDEGEPVRDGYGNAFAGSAACADCHKDIYKSNIQTAHYRDSRPASGEYIKGSFDSARNIFVYANGTQVAMRHIKDKFFQTGFKNGSAYRSETFDIVIGSGRKGQSYLYWDSGKLFQLPVSYFTPANSWVNSPGYRNDSADFNRRIPASCIECHSTYARTVFHGQNEFGDYFDGRQIVYGIDCERCHGPGAGHVEYQRAHAGERVGKYIINAARLSRQQKLDACALCHSGSRYPSKPPFAFRVGDKLDDFSEAKYQREDVSTLDVHGNQYGLLISSKCFIQSQMECSSCHNVHANEAGALKTYSQRCMTCHTQAAHNTCTMPATARLVLSDNCIDCHMPALPSKKIVLTMSGVTNGISTLVRTHHIAIYRESTRDYLQKLKK